ncbi:putative propionyl-CoA carboxylase, partial [Trifolium medium]|nr:putative propionyl-CoA carboxylase [Trifolium medium]
KAEGSGGVLNFSTCAEQLLYEIGDPSAYVTPDVVIDFQDVSFLPLSNCRVLCLGAKPSTISVPDKLLQLVPKVHFLIILFRMQLSSCLYLQY